MNTRPPTLPLLRRVGRLVRVEVVRLNWRHHFADPDGLAGACAIASWIKSKVLTHLRIAHTFVMGSYFAADEWLGEHCWIEVPFPVEPKRILDVTATQFNEPTQVRVVACPHPSYVPIRVGQEAIQDVLSRRWEEQSPVLYKADMEAATDHILEKLTAGPLAIDKPLPGSKLTPCPKMPLPFVMTSP